MRVAVSTMRRAFLVVGEGGHGEGLLARAAEGVVGVVAGHADLIFRLFVKRLQIVVADRPVLQRGILDLAVSGAEAEILRHKAPGHGAVAHRAPADAAGVVIVVSFAGKDNAGGTVGIDNDAAIAPVVGTKGIAESGGALGTEFVVVVLIVTRPVAALQQDDAQTRQRQFLGHDPAPGAGTDDDGINFGQ